MPSMCEISLSPEETSISKPQQTISSTAALLHSLREQETAEPSFMLQQVDKNYPSPIFSSPKSSETPIVAQSSSSKIISNTKKDEHGFRSEKSPPQPTPQLRDGIRRGETIRQSDFKAMNLDDSLLDSMSLSTANFIFGNKHMNPHKAVVSEAAADAEVLNFCLGKRESFFPSKLHKVVSDEAFDCIQWLPSGKAFMITNKEKLLNEVLPKEFGMKLKFYSFTRKLTRWQFVRIGRGPLKGAYFNPYFVRDDHSLVFKIGVVGTGDHSEDAAAYIHSASSPAKKKASRPQLHISHEGASQVVSNFSQHSLTHNNNNSVVWNTEDNHRKSTAAPSISSSNNMIQVLVPQSSTTAIPASRHLQESVKHLHDRLPRSEMGYAPMGYSSIPLAWIPSSNLYPSNKMTSMASNDQINPFPNVAKKSMNSDDMQEMWLHRQQPAKTHHASPVSRMIVARQTNNIQQQQQMLQRQASVQKHQERQEMLQFPQYQNAMNHQQQRYQQFILSQSGMTPSHPNMTSCFPMGFQPHQQVNLQRRVSLEHPSQPIKLNHIDPFSSSLSGVSSYQCVNPRRPPQQY